MLIGINRDDPLYNVFGPKTVSCVKELVASNFVIYGWINV